MDVKEEIETWKKDIGLSTIDLNNRDEIAEAMNITPKQLAALTPALMDETLSVLAAYLFRVAYEMGTLYARVRYLQDTGQTATLHAQRIKLNIIKPVHDALKIKIEVYRKIYERKVWEARNAASGRS